VKITVIIGSPHGMRGNTGRLLEEVMVGLGATTELELLDLSMLNLQPCLGCDSCHKSGICHLPDDYEMIKARLLASDGFILASPNYIFSVTAQLKALFDRSSSLIHCLALEGKYGAVAVTSGGADHDELLRYMVRYINSTGAQSVGTVSSFVTGRRSFPKQAELFEKARELGSELCRCIREQDHFPDQAGYRGSFKARMKRLVESRKEDWSFEFQYWQNRN
jgi:multimeric flavodoxin WrbA